jgi:hypothetical protein
MPDIIEPSVMSATPAVPRLRRRSRDRGVDVDVVEYEFSE